jgi:hypothetical protein
VERHVTGALIHACDLQPYRGLLLICKLRGQSVPNLPHQNMTGVQAQGRWDRVLSQCQTAKYTQPTTGKTSEDVMGDDTDMQCVGRCQK